MNVDLLKGLHMEKCHSVDRGSTRHQVYADHVNTIRG